MLIIGAKGFAIQLFDVLTQLNLSSACVYYDDTSSAPISFLSEFAVLRNFEEGKRYIETKDSRFVLGIGNPKIRSYFHEKFSSIGGQPTTIVSPYAKIGTYKVSIGAGSCILSNTVIESTAEIGEGCLINLNVTITHGCKVGICCEVCPGVHISGDCIIGDRTFIGTGAVVLPKVKIGDNVIIGAGAVVTKNIPSNVIVKGNPGRIYSKPIK